MLRAALARALATGLAAALAAGCAREPSAPPPPAGAPAPPDPAVASVLLVTLDTFRADAAGSGGSPTGRTPWLDRLARTGVQFETGVTVTPLTLPSHTTMLTGLIPPDHGVRSNGTFRLADDVPTLAEALRARGFATGAFLGAFALDGRFGLGRGFDTYDDDVGTFEGRGTFEMARRPGSAVVAAAEAWVGAEPAGARRFEWVHLFDAHRPHDAPAVWRRACGDVPYLGEIAETDAFLGRRLRALALADDPAWVVVLGDHGESEGDHGEETHGLFVYASTMRVPAIVWPAPRGERPGPRDAVFRVVDLPATVFALLGLPPGEAPGDGGSAFGAPAPPAYMETLYPYLHHGWADLRAVRDGRWKYVRAPEPELYDLLADPGETDNLVDERPEEVARLAARLDGFVARERKGTTVALDPAAREALESLGYVTSLAAPEAGADRPDPKRMVPVNELLMSAMRAWGEGGWEVARTRLARALALDPDNKEVTKTMGLLHAATGRHDLAVEWLKRSIELPPENDDPFPHGELARSYLELGRAGDALRELEIAVRLDPDDPSAWNNRGAALARLGRMDEARASWRHALALDPGFETARQSLERATGAPTSPRTR